MKKINIIFWFSIIIICVTLFSACKKDNKDFRAQWSGDWDFVVEHYYRVGGSSTLDTSYYLGKISLGNNDDELNVEYRESTLLTLNVDKSGNIFKYFQDPHYYAKGKFEEKVKVHIECGYEGLGSTSRCAINGIRKKGGKNE